MKAAETGHLLISTLHTPDATTTVSRIVAMFPAEEQDIARIRLADSLHAVISQRLLPRADGHGRAAALEIMIVTSTIRDLIRDRNRTGEIRDHIAEGKDQYGMQTFDQCLMDLVEQGEVTFEVARGAASNPSDFELQLKTLRRRSRTATATDVAQALKATPAPKPAPAKAGSGDELPPGLSDGLTDLMPQ
jgi:twitching motility protein PilT